MKKNFDFYANTKKNWNHGEGLPDACDVLRDVVNENANTILAFVADRRKLTEDDLFNIWGADIKGEALDAFKSLGLPEGTTMNMALGHPVWQNLCIVNIIKCYAPL